MKNGNSPETTHVPRIMIVDDIPANLDLLSNALKESGYSVRSSLSGKLALKAAFNDPPDLILLDIMMPDMDGYEICRQLKENGATKDIPVIFITALDSNDDEEIGLSLGAVDYIVKPIKFPIAFARINTQLQLKLHRDHLENLVKERTASLEHSNQELVSEIAVRKNAEKMIQQSLFEKEVLLKELHHRVKNNMQLIIGMINMQIDFDEIDETKKTPEGLFSILTNRIQSIAHVHELLYHTEDFSVINFKNYLYKICDSLLLSYEEMDHRIEIEIHSDNVLLDITIAVPFGLIINELISISLQHALHSDKKEKISISLTCDDNIVKMSVGDKGFDFLLDSDFSSQKPLDLQLVTLLTKQIDGKCSYVNNNGKTIVIEFPRSVINKKNSV